MARESYDCRMRLVFVLLDSLVRDVLPQYAGDAAAFPNFARLSGHCSQFNSHFVGSLPCMPARRDLHNGRLNFFHRHWGPLEPFDDSFVSVLRDRGAYTHLITDHYHYFEEGGWSFHTRYNSWEFFRGQETDAWRGVAPPLDVDDIVDELHPDIYDLTVLKFRQHALNRARIRKEKDFSARKCFDAALRFLDENRKKDDWLLHLEVFDPHEPFHAPPEYLEAEGIDPDAGIADWPSYGSPDYDADIGDRLRRTYKALLRFCDAQIGRLLDRFDSKNLWDDTALILTTDHGFMLSEHGFWGKSVMPLYNQISRIPLFIHIPGIAPQQVETLSQTPDIAPTILDLFGCPATPDMTGGSLLPACGGNATGRDFCVFGIWGGPLNCTDGQNTLFLDPDEHADREEMFHYSLMPVDVKKPIDIADLQAAKQHPPFDFTKGVPLWQIPTKGVRARGAADFLPVGEMLFDLKADPAQSKPIEDPAATRRLKSAMKEVLLRHDAPRELLERFNMEQKEDCL